MQHFQKEKTSVVCKRYCTSVCSLVSLPPPIVQEWGFPVQGVKPTAAHSTVSCLKTAGIKQDGIWLPERSRGCFPGPVHTASSALLPATRLPISCRTSTASALGSWRVYASAVAYFTSHVSAHLTSKESFKALSQVFIAKSITTLEHKNWCKMSNGTRAALELGTTWMVTVSMASICSSSQGKQLCYCFRSLSSPKHFQKKNEVPTMS